MIFNSFILSNFNYCPLVWHFCGKVNTAKIENIQEQALRYIYRDVKCPYDALLSRSSTPTLFLSRLGKLAFEVFKTINDFNPIFMKDKISMKPRNYDFRNTYCSLPDFTYGRHSFQYFATHIYNLFT